MQEAIDGFVIKNVFQPVADRLAPRISAFNIARFFCDGILVWVLFELGHAFYQHCTPEVVVRLASSGIGIVIYRLILWLAEIEWNHHSPHQGRRFFLVMRLLALFGLCLCVARGDVPDTLGVILLVCSAYFSSCALKQSV